MDLFKQLWNGVWHSEVPRNETIHWMVDSGLAETICFAMVVVPVVLAFGVYLYCLNWRYWEQPKRQFERRHSVVEQTGDFTVYDLSDEELDAFEAEIDF